MSTLSAFVSQAIIVPVTTLGQLTKRRAKLGSASILGSVFPQLTISLSAAQKRLHILSPADDFMLQETAELLSQLQQTCQQLGIAEDEFTLSLQGQNFVLTSRQAQHQQLANLLQQDKCFMDKISWLQPNYLALANSLEWLSFADSYDVSRVQACQRFVHLQQHDHGLHCYLRKRGEHVDFVLESPMSLFKVSLG